MSQSLLDEIRAAGWLVAVHNDYKIGGVPYTFWLFTKAGRAVKGKGKTDEEALRVVMEEIRRDDFVELTMGTNYWQAPTDPEKQKKVQELREEIRGKKELPWFTLEQLEEIEHNVLKKGWPLSFDGIVILVRQLRRSMLSSSQEITMLQHKLAIARGGLTDVRIAYTTPHKDDEHIDVLADQALELSKYDEGYDPDASKPDVVELLERATSLLKKISWSVVTGAAHVAISKEFAREIEEFWRGRET